MPDYGVRAGDIREALRSLIQEAEDRSRRDFLRTIFLRFDGIPTNRRLSAEDLDPRFMIPAEREVVAMVLSGLLT